MTSKNSTTLKPLNLTKLRADLALIMSEIDRSHGILPDYYSPVMWQRLQETAEKVANAIQAVRMKSAHPDTTCEEIGNKLGIHAQSVAGYLAWNTMLAPDWVKPSIVIATTACPKCKVTAGVSCDYCSAPKHKIHKERREAFKASSLGAAYLANRAETMEEKYGITAVAN